MGISFSNYLENKNKKNIVLIVGSARSDECCPDEESKTHKISKQLVENFKDRVNFQLIDLAVKCNGINVLPCKACVSTSAFHCHFPCSCYSKKSDPKDLMYEQNVYDKLLKCDGFFTITPVNWSAPSSVVKSLFDRLVCANLTVTTGQAKEILGEEDLKNSRKTREVEKSCEYGHLLKNHLEGKVAGFFAHGNGGGADYIEFTKKQTNCSAQMPESMIEYQKTHGEENYSKILEPLVRQCVYSGIKVPDDCVKTFIFASGKTYSEGNDLFEKNKELYNNAKKTFLNFIEKI